MKKLNKTQKVIINYVCILLIVCGILATFFLVFHHQQILIDIAYNNAEETVYPEYAIGTTSQLIHNGDTVKGIASELHEKFNKQGYDISESDIYWIIRDLNGMDFSAEADCIEVGKTLKVPYIYECGIWYTNE